MLREPSFKPPVSEDGEVGASDDDDEDDESETEVEGGDHQDSEDETETDMADKGKGKGKKKAVPLRQRLTGTGKGKQKTALSPGAGIAPVSEEPGEHMPCWHHSKLIPDSPGVSSSAFGGSSIWGLGTPKEKGGSSVWAQFRSGTPGAATPIRPQTNDNTRSNSYQTDSTDSYFGSQPGSSLNVTTSSLPINQVGNLNRASNPAEGVAALDATVQPDVVVEEEPLNEGDSDDADNDDTSSHGHSSINHASPQPMTSMALPDVRPASIQRPSMYHQASQSMINIGTPAPGSSDAGPSTPGPSTPTNKLQTIRSRENAPGKIDLPKPRLVAGMPTPGAEWAKPPPTPAAGFGGMFWSRKDGDKPAMKRRRSAGDKELAPPEYSVPLPGVVIPRPRDEEGREKLPKYWCAVSLAIPPARQD